MALVQTTPRGTPLTDYGLQIQPLLTDLAMVVLDTRCSPEQVVPTLVRWLQGDASVTGNGDAAARGLGLPAPSSQSTDSLLRLELQAAQERSSEEIPPDLAEQRIANLEEEVMLQQADME